MGERRDTLVRRHPALFHGCQMCRRVGLRPGILGTKYGDYGMRESFKTESELALDADGLCEDCARERRRALLLGHA